MVAALLSVKTAAGGAVTERARFVVSPLDQALGLMFRFRMPRTALLFVLAPVREVTIHMWCVFFPIDVVFLDENKRVVRAMMLRPWRIAERTRAAYVLELPVGSIARAKISCGDTLLFSPVSSQRA